MTPTPKRDLLSHRVIRASAGTGKTYRLAMRYIGLLAREKQPSSLLATTFTKKAAGEMLDRVMKFLARGATRPDMLEELHEYASPTLTHAQCRELLILLVANLHRHNVLNIDKLFLRIASGFSLELGVAPGWQLVDPEEDTNLRIQALSNMLAASPTLDTLNSLINLTRGGNPSAVHAPILNALKAAYLKFLAAKQELVPWQAIQPESPPLTAAQLAQAIKALRESARDIPLTGKKKPNSHFVTAFEDAEIALSKCDWGGFLRIGLAKPLCKVPPHTFHNLPIPDSIHEAYLPLIGHALAVLRAQLFDANTALHKLLHSFNEHYNTLKASNGTFLFDDIPRLLLALDYHGERDHIYYKLDARIRHILLDEFQDTSLQQFELLEPLITECRSSDDGRTMFIVGDTKQSLYGWRGAEPALLGEIDRKLGIDNSYVEELKVNFRSSPAVIDAVNMVFSNLSNYPAFVELGGAAAAKWQSTFQTHQAHHNTRAGEVLLNVSPEAADTDPKAVFAQLATYTAQRVKAIYDSVPAASIAILLRRNKWIPALRFELSQLGIESSQEGGGPLTDSPAICAILSLFHLATHPADTIARYHLSTSPVGKVMGLTDHRSNKQALEVSRYMRTEVLVRGVTPALISLRKRLLPYLAERDHARLTQLIAFGADFDAKANPDPAAFCEAVTSHAMVDPNPSRVRIMSIHKAKGLEFDAVFLPQFESVWQRKAGELFVHRDTPFSSPSLLSLSPSKELGDADPAFTLLKDARFEEIVGEELCCLYVGMTRAIHHLEIIVPPAKPREGGNPSAARVYCEGLAPGVSRDAETALYTRSQGDWKAWKNEHSTSRAPATSRITLKLAKSTKLSPLHLPRTSPSSLERAASPAATDILQPRHDQSLDRGTLIHAWFEFVEWASSQLPPDSELLAHSTKLGISESSAAEQLPTFKAMLVIPAIRTALSIPSGTGTWKLKREWPFSVQISHNRRPTMLNGRFDRVHICFVNDKPIAAHILDFKTDALTTAPIEKSIETYRPQMAAYRSALSVLLKLDPSSIAASLLFVSRGDVVSV